LPRIASRSWLRSRSTAVTISRFGVRSRSRSGLRVSLAAGFNLSHPRSTFRRLCGSRGKLTWRGPRPTYRRTSDKRDERRRPALADRFGRAFGPCPEFYQCLCPRGQFSETRARIWEFEVNRKNVGPTAAIGLPTPTALQSVARLAIEQLLGYAGFAVIWLRRRLRS
jgi:hypothetical protein